MNPRLIAGGLIGLAVTPCLLLYTGWPTAWLFLPDDAFYYLQIARNLADGYGSTFDRLAATNGYHPAWQGLTGLLALVFDDRQDLIRAAMALSCLLAAIGLWCAFRLAWPRAGRARALTAGLAACALLWNFYFSKALINGLESALLFAWLAWFGLFFSRWVPGPESPGAKRALLMGLMASGVIASRLDGVFLLPAACLTWLLLRGFQARELTSLGWFLLPPLAGLALYLALNQHFFGLAWPVSGLVKRSLPGWVVYPAWPILGAVCLLAGGWLLALGPRPARPLGAAPTALVLLSLYLLMVQTDSALSYQHNLPRIWHLAPWMLWAFLVLCLAAGRVLDSGPGAWQRAALGGGGLVLAAALAFSWVARLDPLSYSHYAAARQAALWARANLPAHTVLAGWSVGMVGYFSQRRVVNLDGLAGSPEFARLLVRGSGGLEYLDRLGVGFLVYYRSPGIPFSRPGFPAAGLEGRLGETVFLRPVIFRAWGRALPLGRPPVLRHDYLIRALRPKEAG